MTSKARGGPSKTDKLEKRSTRDRIVDAAIELFNEHGASAVTTNHVADHAGISPGNLYYHFANKEEIIREAFERVNDAASSIWSFEPGASPDATAFHAMLSGNLELFARYAFLARELPTLLRADPVLRVQYTEIATRRTRELEDLLRPFITAGVLKDLGEGEGGATPRRARKRRASRAPPTATLSGAACVRRARGRRSIPARIIEPEGLT